MKRRQFLTAAWSRRPVDRVGEARSGPERHRALGVPLRQSSGDAGPAERYEAAEIDGASRLGRSGT